MLNMGFKISLAKLSCTVVHKTNPLNVGLTVLQKDRAAAVERQLVPLYS